jgi:hypothetical protein
MQVRTREKYTMKRFGCWCLSLSFIVTMVALGLNCRALAQSADPNATAPLPPGMPSENPLIGKGGANDLPQCGPGVKAPCQAFVLSHPFPTPALPASTSAGQRRSYEADLKRKHFVTPAQRMVPPALAEYLNSPQYKEWAATHGTHVAYWHCYDPATKSYYGVKVPSL